MRRGGGDARSWGSSSGPSSSSWAPAASVRDAARRRWRTGPGLLFRSLLLLGSCDVRAGCGEAAVAHGGGEGRAGAGVGAVWAGGARGIWSAAVEHDARAAAAASGRRRAGWARVCVRVRRGVGPGGDKKNFFFLKNILCREPGSRQKIILIFFQNLCREPDGLALGKDPLPRAGQPGSRQRPFAESLTRRLSAKNC